MTRPSSHWVTVLVLLAVLAGSLALKVARYGMASGTDRQLLAETRVSEFLAAEGFLTLGSRNLTTGGSIREVAYAHPGCPGPIRVVVLGADGAYASLMGQGAPGEATTYLWQGRSYPSLPRLPLILGRLSEAVTQVLAGSGGPSPMPVLAVTAPIGAERCPVPEPVAWPT